jgi:Protein of unknown function (DUF998)
MRRKNRQKNRALLACAAAAGPVFLTAATVEGANRPGYDPLRHPISSLSLGPGGWQQMANFGVTGALYVAGAVGLGRSPVNRTTALLVAAVGAGLLGAGAFRTDPVNGYPPGTPAAHEHYSPLGALHDGFSTPVFLGVPAAGLVQAVSALRRGERGWAAYSAGSAVTMFGTFALAGAGFSQQPRFVRWGGLFQRAALGVGFGYLSALAGRTLRTIR